MKLSLLTKEYIFENSNKGIDDLLGEINSFLMSENIFFSHLEIDGQQVYEGIEEYISDNIANIKEIKTVVKTKDEFVEEILVSLNNYTNRAIPEIEILINDFYQNPSEESWMLLKQFLEGINWIYQAIKIIDSVGHNVNSWGEFVKCAVNLELELPNLLDAIKKRDSILIADIIQYEILIQIKIIYDKTEWNIESWSN